MWEFGRVLVWVDEGLIVIGLHQSIILCFFGIDNKRKLPSPPSLSPLLALIKPGEDPGNGTSEP